MRRPALVLLAVVAACAAAGGAAAQDGSGPSGAGARAATKNFRLLQSWLAGSFSNHAQAARDSSFRDIRMRIADIWPGREGGRWYYVEQAVAGHEDAPYRQFAFRLTLKEDGRCEGAVFALPSPSRFVGAWRQPAERRLAALTPDSLAQREGCAVYLRLQKDRFVGGPEGADCASDPRYARFAASGLEVQADRIVTVGRGVDARGVPDRGHERGGYVFMRVQE